MIPSVRGLMIVRAINFVITDEVLGSYLVEFERILNMRPLVTVSFDAKH